ncbi:MAG: thiamine-phosphate kinase [Rhodothermales bacterium]|nr:thiamine-phosphate kinase [Rhodothermales bacterium]
MEPSREDFTPIERVGEFGLIDRLHTVLGEAADDQIVCGIGDDAAVLQKSEGLYQVVTVDALIEGVHFERSIMPMGHLGFKSIAVNVSDVAAMNARPRFALISVAIPHSVSIEMMEAFYSGIRRACDTYGLTMVGGDTTAARQLSVSVTVIGEVEEHRVVFRRGAVPGDLICVSGDLGSAYAGLKVLIRERIAMQEVSSFEPKLAGFDYVIGRQLAPSARMDLVNGWEAAGFMPRAMIDVSDGLSSEIHHLCRHSGCGALIRRDAIPIHEQTRAVADDFEDDPVNFALFGGEDYELLFAARAEDYSRIDDGRCNVIGIFTDPDEGIRMQDDDGEYVGISPDGFKHF